MTDSFLLVLGLVFAIGTLVFAYLWRVTKPVTKTPAPVPEQLDLLKGQIGTTRPNRPTPTRDTAAVG
jgi:hypothetical protein